MTRNCTNKCMEYKTELGYLCDNSEGTYLNKQLFKIPESDVTHNRLILSTPQQKNGYYWDFIREKNKTKVCIINQPHASEVKYKKCVSHDLLVYLKYLFGVFASLFMVPQVLGGAHLSQTLQLVGKTDMEVLRFLLKKFKEELKQNKIPQPEIDLIGRQLDAELSQIASNDTAKMGKFMKDIFNLSQKSNNVSTPVIQFLVSFVPDKYVMEALRGANFKIEDGGKMYQYSQTTMRGYGRFSTHAKNATDVIQYGVTDMFADTYLHMLCGKFDYENGQTVSWFQLEGAPMPPGLTTVEVFKNILTNGSGNRLKYLQQYADHFVDSETYLIVKAMITLTKGKAINLAIGTSEHVDTAPIVLGSLLKTRSKSQKKSQKNSKRGTNSLKVSLKRARPPVLHAMNVAEIYQLTPSELGNNALIYTSLNGSFYAAKHASLAAAATAVGVAPVFSNLKQQQQQQLQYAHKTFLPQPRQASLVLRGGSKTRRGGSKTRRHK